MRKKTARTSKAAGSARKASASKSSSRSAATKESSRPAASRKRTAQAKKTKTARPAEPKRTRARAKTTKPAVIAPDAPVTPETAVGTSNLSPADVEEFRQMLLQKRRELLGDVDTLQSEAGRGSRKEASGDLSSMPVHMADLGTDNYELEFTLGLLQGGRAMLAEIDEALERVRKGTYGICAATGKPIGKARLRAKPWAKYCYEHTLAIERGQAHG